MKISEINFRDVDHKWIGIENKKNCKKIAKKLKIKELIAPARLKNLQDLLLI